MSPRNGKLIQIASGLNTLRSQKIEVIEIVTGTRFHSVTHRPTPQPHGVFIVDFADRAQSQNQLVQSLETIVTGNGINDGLLSLYKPNSTETDPVRPVLALEVEPGPFFLLNRIEPLSQIAKELQSRDALRKTVGINADLSHLRLVGIFPEVLSQPKYQHILHQITHIHLSGIFPRGHVGDVPPLEFQTPDEHLEMLEVIDEYFPKGNFSRLDRPLISLEYEAVRDTAIWKEAIDQTLDQIL